MRKEGEKKGNEERGLYRKSRRLNVHQAKETQYLYLSNPPKKRKRRGGTKFEGHFRKWL